ncbi:MAG TPA: NAD(P)-binding protein, partial [Vicinamibacterales bacterium]|nr:NAD(P)-binding protein [Vicinamibacterales bacterium]
RACPAGEDIQRWLYHSESGDYEAAWRELVKDNPLAAVMGRVCYHPCEISCNRAQVDDPVGIHGVERFLGDEAVRQGWKLTVDAEPTGKRVLIVGAGPSGLSAAYHLTRRGHAVTIREAGPMAGGMMRFGIPQYRLPRHVLDAEIKRILDLGVTLELNRKVSNILEEMQDGGFHAVFLAVGAHIGKRAYIPAGEAAHILEAVTVLRSMEGQERPLLGRRVVVYGGGNTAMDAARTAKRLGADEALIVYRRDRAHMPARAFEADEAEEEGVRFKWLSTITEIAGSNLTVEIMDLDEHGRPRPTGRFERLEADAIVLALGQETDSAFLRRVPGLEFGADGAVRIGADMMIGHPGVFAGGDMVPGEQSVTVSVGEGKLAARHISAWLRGARYQEPARPPIVTFSMLHLPVYSDADPSAQQTLEAAERVTGFEEVVAGLSEAEARYEAQRCFSCGTCYECDNCYAACPEDAIVKLGPGHRYRVDYARCTGCAVCFEQCPCHAMEMVPEPEGGH